MSAAAAHAAPLPTIVVALGDSTTAGTPGFLSPLEAPPDGRGDPESQSAYWMAKARPAWRVLNRGVNGERADEIRARFETSVTAEKPTVVVVLAGVNDAYQDRRANETEADLLWMWRRAKEIGAVPVAATILPFSRANPAQNARLAALNAWIKKTAAAEKVAVCDTARAAADPTDATKLKASPDGLHPDPATYRAVADALVKTISEVIQRKGPGPKR